MGWVIVVVAFLIWLVLVLLFTPRIDYRVSTPLRPDSGEFLHVVQVTCQAAVHFHNRVDILTNGAQFYPAMRDAILQATGSINFEAYIFQPGDAADMLIDAMIARARDGVDVRLVLDSIGSSGMGGQPARRLREAGCRLYFYQPITWYASTGSTTAHIASCSSSTGASRLPAVRAWPIGGTGRRGRSRRGGSHARQELAVRPRDLRAGGVPDAD